jgi:hypothetical protein
MFKKTPTQILQMDAANLHVTSFFLHENISLFNKIL